VHSSQSDCKAGQHRRRSPKRHGARRRSLFPPLCLTVSVYCFSGKKQMWTMAHCACKHCLTAVYSWQIFSKQYVWNQISGRSWQILRPRRWGPTLAIRPSPRLYGSHTHTHTRVDAARVPRGNVLTCKQTQADLLLSGEAGSICRVRLRRTDHEVSRDRQKQRDRRGEGGREETGLLRVCVAYHESGACVCLVSLPRFAAHTLTLLFRTPPHHSLGPICATPPLACSG
jgi:hypothetical protein